ncbi:MULTISPECIES: SDR family NAD(P)-dependent oxidoreductase [unclassified Burkholderia]|uniref:SDR family NAD(P)-dependent oxidoreductase n=1 Tax=unclassified Burkholderia TaxID=2613784 RepID=UPI002150681F|nr:MULTISPECIES: SDR family NAD(P)-dependent oxidoreductase [unclassified Burkholderia]MCR4471887.1 SDR family oxidoreductase [Burkholderia sp. SCN-KJ]
MNSRKSSRVALVTGAASGIGRRTAEKLALDQGASVYVLDRDAEAAAAVVRGIRLAGGRAASCVLDLAVSARLHDALDSLTEEFGPPNILVNNAGISAMVPALECSLEYWQTTMAVNVTAPMLLMQYVLPHMRKANWGRIVNISSISGLRAGTGRMAYGTSKAALIAMTQQFAIEAAPWGVTINSVAPGPVDTPLALANHSAETRSTYEGMVPMHRYGTPDEIADGILFLCSDQASYITGHTLPIDGGFVVAGVLVNNLYDKEAPESKAKKL